ncbi:response regulator transcription factor [Streptobacillus moniliformis]|uniref:Two component transcriptional regulator, LuxR family n=1 Tax=Streptobacillus moniliformis (strain ATCC 14647 / DSM 12112 / NCTC 10651 / 9901) TaxID=519441 RepID=D1AVR6_STRM9|nr:response regulator transcription factor [Streptobacillus moniliformis]ACZ01826.1 two component transcriptional regulator, LuxR family [Streptobacillus moniliformis DSM 12112]AVL43180.1 DNA-binding response regulator [Streptobacillus moniliformis]SQA12976.1 Transcriptional regulatory protein uhpA [Streptobacillus moniliformis]
MKILLIDDHKLFALSIQMILGKYKEIERIDVITDSKQLEKKDIKDYDIYLIDINLNNISEETGLELAEKLIKKDKNICIVILTGHLKLMYEDKANKIGVRGFIDKNIDPEELIKILKLIYSGGRYFKNIKFEGISHNNLTSTEIKILELTRKGESIDEITKKAYISKRTVFNHLNNIYSKLGVTNKQEAIYKAQELGYFF